jgi:hypothetical protein
MNVLKVRGMTFIPDNTKPDLPTHKVKLYGRKILKGDMVTLQNCVNVSYV